MRAFLKNMSLSTLLLTLLTGVANAETITLTFNRWTPPSFFLNTEVFEPWMKEIEQATDGRVQIEVPAASLAPPQRQFDMVRQGIADLGFSAQSYTPGRFTSSESVELPFIGGNSAEAVSVAYWRAYQKYFVQADEYKGVKLLGLFTHAPGDIFTASTELNSLEDIEGLKLRIVNPATGRVAEAYDANAVSAPSTKTYELLSHGVADGTFFTADAVYQFNLPEFLNNQLSIDGGFYNTSFFLVLNQSSWDKISRADQKAIEALSGEALARRIGKAWDKKVMLGQEKWAKAGKKSARINGSNAQAVKEKLDGIEKDWIATANKKGVEAAAALRYLRQEVDGYHSN